ncbi:unnamed protein product [Effrenium voratum]|uniref:Uncharacterized protein n=1 Tax=Effrenium voratum TaxID=2562239 RepID=A0AA36IUA5_9DINO|nr:unnamed protein product [Effrenium voratum]
MEAAKLVSAPSQAGSELNTSVGGTSQHSLERRVAWLEEDVAVIHRRVKVECADTGGIAGDPGLRALVARLDGELAQERRARELLEVRMSSLEEALKREHSEREANMKSFSQDLESTMRGGRIDDGLSSGAASMRDRTDQTEVRLRSLIKRVDEGLTAGAAALQDSLSQSANGAEKLPERSVGRDRSAAPRGSVSPVTQQQQQQQHTQLQHQQQQQQPQLQHQQHHQHQQHSQHQVMRQAAYGMSRQRSPQTSQAPSHARSPLHTPSAAFPCSLQVPGTGLNAPGLGYPRQAPTGRVPMGWAPSR